MNKGLTAFVALGSNQSSATQGPQQLLRESLRLFAGESLFVISQSDWYATPAFPAGSGPNYVNAVACVKTTLTPDAVLAALHRIEAASGRERKARWAARTCDLDLLAMGQEIAPDPASFLAWAQAPIERQMASAPDRLILPHPRIQDRGFVLVPLNDIAPDWLHPVFKKTPAEMLSDLTQAERAEITKISDI